MAVIIALRNRQNLNLWSTIMYIFICSCFGIAIGTAIDNLALGITIGVAVGVVIESSRSSKRKKTKQMKINIRR